MNAFESGARKVIPAVLIYARSSGKILMVHRNAPDRPDDYHAGKWNGLGGKLELDESPSQAACREFTEECGIELPEERFVGLGCLQFPGFKAHKSEDWVVWVFTVDLDDSFSEQSLIGPEGALHWVAEGDVMGLALWAGDSHFLPYVLSRRPFMGTIWYRGQEVVRAEIQKL